ncbi:MAG TPA: sigma-70 family RNA polymerase sigma factor [Micromonosporaceae bacterium]|jgi:RNA polymerase sigma-70 factor (ECF subfamily)
MSAPRSDDDVTALALAAKLGDRDAATAFIAATRGDVRRFVTHLVDASSAEDLVQETYLRAMRSLPRFAAQSSAKTWLLSIARRVAADHIRTLQRQPRTQSSDDWPDVAERAAPRTRFDEAVAISQLVDALDDDRRLAFVATQLLGLSYAEAAEVCDVPVGTIRSRVARARDDLIHALRSDERPDERPVRHLRATS